MSDDMVVGCFIGVWVLGIPFAAIVFRAAAGEDMEWPIYAATWPVWILGLIGAVLMLLLFIPACLLVKRGDK